MATMDEMNVVERHRLASVGEVAVNWRSVARLLPGITEADVVALLPRGLPDSELSVKFFELLSNRQVPQADVWAAMAEAGLRAFIPPEAMRKQTEERLRQAEQEEEEQRRAEAVRRKAEDEAKLAEEQEALRRLKEEARRLEEQRKAEQEAAAQRKCLFGAACTSFDCQFDHSPPKSPFAISTFNLPLPRSDIRIVRRAAIDYSLAMNADPSRSDYCSSNVVVVTACGLGGVGKTTALYSYVHEAERTYLLRAWLPADKIDVLEKDFIMLGERLGVWEAGVEGKPTEARIRAVKDWLEQHPGWLLVFDNAEGPDDLGPFLPTKGGVVLISSRWSDWPYGTQLSVDEMSPDEAVGILRQGDSSCSDDDLQTLADELGYLPLALSHATAYMRKLHKSAAEYLALFSGATQGSLLEYKGNRHEKSVAACYAVTLDKLEPTCSAFARIWMRTLTWTRSTYLLINHPDRCCFGYSQSIRRQPN
eukprot:TRINITY_DN2143_c0_g1_i2.p1 TRINITY_DN2143_c0_g1~~TRINITY_DN2143_c0_g1_i2.p1  ORF type:complete len:478 (-),score=74.84 TRINITY_DN2143_c0_g1_i2:3-1436(-)